ncbi:MAG: hypothetical protein ACJ8JD_12205, partial [Chthoniobacterales bacterium]
IYQIDPNTGKDITSLSPVARTTPRPLTIKATPDHKTLFVAEQNYLAPALAKYTLSSGSAPRLAQLMNPLTPDSVSAIAVSPDGTRMVAITRAATAQPQPNIIRSTGDLNTVLGSIPAPFPVDEIVFSFDGLYVAQSYQYGSQYSGRVDTIRISTGAIERSTTLPTFYSPISYASRPSLAVDSTSSRFFLVAGQNGNWDQESVFQYALHGPPVPPKTLMNVSTRLRTQTGDNVLIGGFIIEGANPKRVIVRAIGPSLKAYGVTGSLADPALELYAADGRVISSSDNWNEHRLDVLGSNMWPADEHESAIVATLEPGAYTAILRGVNETTGVALVEFFDLDPSSGSRITNLSTRGKVETGDNVMIGGFIIAGDQPTKVIVRAVGPSLTQYGVAGALDDSTLDLFDGSGAKVASNDDWASDQGGEIVACGHQPSDPREAAIVRTLPPGSYTAIVRGKNNSTGVALVEIYNLEPAAN